MSEIQKDLEDFSAGMVFLKNKILFQFSYNLRTKLTRSTLASPGPTRVNIFYKISEHLHSIRFTDWTSKDRTSNDLTQYDLYIQESNLAISSCPVTNNNVQFIYWAYCYHVKNWTISSSAPGLSEMTLRECRVDCPFPVTWLGDVWEPAPPGSTGLSWLSDPRFPGLKIRYRYALTWTCDWLFWFSFISNLITPDITPLGNCKIGA